MNSNRGMRSTLQVGLCVAAACLLHAALFLIPGVRFGPKEAFTERGVRLRVFRPEPSAPSSRRANPTLRQAAVPTGVSPERHSKIGGNTDGETLASPQPSAGGSGGSGGPAGDAPAVSEYGQFLATLRSDSVQGWAREAARMVAIRCCDC